MYPPLPTSFHRVSAVLIFRWYSHKWVGPDWCYWYQWASNNSEVNQTWGDAAEENWAWWDHHFTTSNSLHKHRLSKLLPLSFPLTPLPSPFFPHLIPILIEERFWLLPKSSPSNHTIQYFYSNYFLNVRHGYEKSIHKTLSVSPYTSISSLYIPLVCVYIY